jgi:hypothetical protein
MRCDAQHKRKRFPQVARRPGSGPGGAWIPPVTGRAACLRRFGDADCCNTATILKSD